VQRGWRPGVIIQNNKGNYHSPNIIAIPLTSKGKCKSQPTHVVIPAKETGLRVDSMALCENPETISKEMMGEYITSIPNKYMALIARALMLSVPIISYLDQDEMRNVWFETSYMMLR
jgi:mRNA interferase MazF